MRLLKIVLRFVDDGDSRKCAESDAGAGLVLRLANVASIFRLLFVLMRRCVAVFREELNQILGPSNMKMIEKQIGCVSLPSTFQSLLSPPPIAQPLCPLPALWMRLLRLQ